jgi:hypothetical protein
MKLYLIAILAGSCLLTPAAAKAQEQVEKRVDALEKIISRLPSISGLLSVRYQGDAEHVETGSFSVPHARLDFKGGFSSFNYRLQLEMAGSPRVLDGFLTWKATPHLNVQVGRYKLPFSLENPLSPTALETIDNSLIIDRLLGGRDNGIGVNGGFLMRRDGSPVFTYNAGIFNGPSSASKSFSGIFTASPVKGLTLAGSYYLGSHDKVAGSSRRLYYSAMSVRYADAKWLLRGEFFTGREGDDNDRSGGYVVGGYFICPALQVIAKFEQVSHDENYMLGCNYSPVKNLRLMLNYTYRERVVPSSVISKPVSNYAALQAQVTF